MTVDDDDDQWLFKSALKVVEFTRVSFQKRVQKERVCTVVLQHPKKIKVGKTRFHYKIKFCQDGKLEYALDGWVDGWVDGIGG